MLIKVGRLLAWRLAKYGFAISLLILLAACGGQPDEPAQTVEYDGAEPIVGETNDQGSVVIKSSRRGLDISVDLDDESETDDSLDGAKVTYREVGDAGILWGFNPDTGAAALRILDLTDSPVAPAGNSTLEPQGVISVSLLLVGTLVAWNELRLLNQEINLTVDRVPDASVEDGVVEMCLTPEDFVYLNLAIAASQEKEIDNYVTFGTGIVLSFAFSSAGDFWEGVGHVLDAGHLVDASHGALTNALHEEVRRRAQQALGRTDLGANDTLRVTFLDFDQPDGLGRAYNWGTMLITGADCDPTDFEEQLGTVAITSPLDGVSGAGDTYVRVEVDPPEEGLDVHLTYDVQYYAFGSPETGYLRRLPPARTNRDGVAQFAVPPYGLPGSIPWVATLSATVPERRVGTHREISWSSEPSDHSPNVWNFGVVGSQAIVNEEATFTFRTLNPDLAQHCEVDWGDGAGWEAFSCTTPRGAGVRSLKHTYDRTGLFAPKLRVSTLEDLGRQAYTLVSTTEPPTNEPPVIELASYDGERFTWRFRHGDPLSFHECQLDHLGAGVLWSTRECAREGSVEIPDMPPETSFLVSSATDGLSHSDRVTVSSPDVNNAPDITRFTATPSTARVGEAVSFSWRASDLDGDTLTCRLDVDGDGATDYERTGSACEQTDDLLHQYDEPDTYTATLTVVDSPDELGMQQAALDVLVEPETSSGVAFTTITAGFQFSLALDQDGNAWAWGFDGNGQLGDGGTDTSMNTPVAVEMPTGTTFTTIAACRAHSLALDQNGNAWSWGYDGLSGLGDGGTDADMDTPVQVAMPTGTTFTTIAGDYHSLALDQDGNAWSWGSDLYGALGDGGTDTSMDTPVAVEMPTGTTFTAIAAGGYHSLALDQNGNVWSWGSDGQGQLGDGGTNTNMDTPVAVEMPTGTTFTAIAAGGYHSLALDQNGNVWSWGDDGYGRLGDGGTSTRSGTPVQVAMPTGTTFTTITAGRWHSLVLDQDSNAWSWGYDRSGQLGDGGTNADMDTPVQVAMPTGTTFTTITGGRMHSLALDQAGNGWSWGRDGSGRLGDGGTNTEMSTPVQVAMP